MKKCRIRYAIYPNKMPRIAEYENGIKAAIRYAGALSAILRQSKRFTFWNTIAPKWWLNQWLRK